jgi:hypothetical protein
MNRYTGPGPEWRNWQTQETQNLPPVTRRVGSIPSSGTNHRSEREDVMKFNLKGVAVLGLFLIVVAFAVNGPDTWIAHLAEAAATVVILLSLGGSYFRRGSPNQRF